MELLIAKLMLFFLLPFVLLGVLQEKFQLMVYNELCDFIMM